MHSHPKSTAILKVDFIDFMCSSVLTVPGATGFNLQMYGMFDTRDTVNSFSSMHDEFTRMFFDRGIRGLHSLQSQRDTLCANFADLRGGCNFQR